MRYTADTIEEPKNLSIGMQTDIHSKAASAQRIVPGSNGDFLLFLGTRVRELRNRRGLTRKMMAKEADVSERHLAQLEAGEGNVSIVLLRRIAAALHVSLAELFAVETETQHEKILIQRFLERLPAHRVEDAVSRLMREFGNEESARRFRVALVGIRGRTGCLRIRGKVQSHPGLPSRRDTDID